jgi:very-short-patch-repair endonuclease
MVTPRHPPLIGPMAEICRSRSRTQRDTIDALASAQHGIVSRAQLLDAGISLHAVDNAVKGGRLRQLHRGVYRVGPVMAQYARETAALLVCGAGAAISHASAGALRRLELPQTIAGDVHVTVHRSAGRGVSGLRIHRSRLDENEISQVDGVRVTTAARTLLDMARQLTDSALERAFAAAERDANVSAEEVRRLVQRHPHHRGAHKLRALIACDQEPALTRSEAEALMLAIVRKAQLPAPATNVRIHGYEVDMYWRAERLVVEVDGYAFHRSRRSFEGGRRRDAVLTAAGLRVMRVTWRQITQDRDATLVRLAQALVR